MIETANKMESPLPFMIYGRVLANDKKGIWVATDHGEHPAFKALSCLIRPEPGDVVLLSLDDEGACFILSVLIRNEGRESSQDIVFEGSVNLHVRGGDLAVTSEREMSFASEKRISHATERIEVHADEGEAIIGRLSFLGRTLTSQFKRIKTAAKYAEHTYGRLTERLKNCFKYVEDHEELQSKSTRRLVEESLTVQSKNSYQLVEDTVKIDAEQIHLG